jgi:hypothetical protein
MIGLKLYLVFDREGRFLCEEPASGPREALQDVKARGVAACTAYMKTKDNPHEVTHRAARRGLMTVGDAMLQTTKGK